MRLYFTIVIALIIGLLSCENKQKTDPIKINGKIKNYSSEKLILKIITDSDIIVLDSMKPNDNGEFEFEIDKPQSFDYFYLTFNNFINIPLIITNEDSEVDLSFNALNPLESIEYENSQQSEKLKLLMDKNRELKKELDSIYVLYRNSYQKSDTDISKFDSIFRAKNTQHYQEFKEIITQNAANPYSILALYLKVGENYVLNIEYDYDVFIVVRDSLEKYYPENIHFKDLNNRVETFETKKEIEAKIEESLNPGNKIQNISGLNPEEGVYELENIKSEKIIVIFWKTSSKASWDLFEYLKKFYDENNTEKLEILAISLDSDKLNWKNTLKAMNINWINLLGSQNLISEFNLQEYPKYFVLDSNKTILAKNPDNDELMKLIK